MNRILFASMLAAALPSAAAAQRPLPLMRSHVSPLTLIADGRTQPGGWHVVPGIGLDEYTTTAATVTFASDVDTFTVRLDEWQSADFGILTSRGDTALVRVSRRAADPFVSPDPRLLDVAASGLLSRRQAAFDIDALVYALSEIHPDMFSVCRQADFMRAVREAKASLPDSLGILELYRRAAPLVSLLGDGHTALGFPFDRVFTKSLKRIPLSFDVADRHTLLCTRSLDSVIPRGARILSVNGRTADEMLASALPYVSGERESFRISQLSYMFGAFFQMLYAADTYTVRYLQAGSRQPREATFPAMTWDELRPRMPASAPADARPYSFRIDRARGLALLDFRAFRDARGMKTFADSLFRTLREEGIRHLVIDIRRNGGGDSSVGDVLLRYLAPEPFTQMERALVRRSPLVLRLLGNPGLEPGLAFFEQSPESYHRPLTEAEGRFDGKVYLLTSPYTFSSAASFAWTFRMTGAGLIVGRETGGMNVSYGDYLRYRLPVSGLQCAISYKRFWQFRASEDDIHGALPDLDVPADEALEAAYRLIRKDKRRGGR